MKARLSIKASQPATFAEQLGITLKREQTRKIRPESDAEKAARRQALKDMGLN